MALIPPEWHDSGFCVILSGDVESLLTHVLAKFIFQQNEYNFKDIHAGLTSISGTKKCLNILQNNIVKTIDFIVRSSATSCAQQIQIAIAGSAIEHSLLHPQVLDIMKNKYKHLLDLLFKGLKDPLIIGLIHEVLLEFKIKLVDLVDNYEQYILRTWIENLTEFILWNVTDRESLKLCLNVKNKFSPGHADQADQEKVVKKWIEFRNYNWEKILSLLDGHQNETISTLCWRWKKYRHNLLPEPSHIEDYNQGVRLRREMVALIHTLFLRFKKVKLSSYIAYYEFRLQDILEPDAKNYLRFVEDLDYFRHRRNSIVHPDVQQRGESLTLSRSSHTFLRYGNGCSEEAVFGIAGNAILNHIFDYHSNCFPSEGIEELRKKCFNRIDEFYLLKDMIERFNMIMRDGAQRELPAPQEVEDDVDSDCDDAVPESPSSELDVAQQELPTPPEDDEEDDSDYEDAVSQLSSSECGAQQELPIPEVEEDSEDAVSQQSSSGWRCSLV